MPRRALVPALALFLFAAHASAEVKVQARGARVDLTASAAPLAEVLDRLGRQVGMKVLYDGPAPRQLVTLTLHDRTPSEAVLSVLEGLGVNFALVWDETGARLQTLMITGAAPAATTAVGQARPAAEPPRRSFGPPSPVEAPDAGFEPEQPEELPGEVAGGSGMPEAGAPTFGPPGADATPGQPNAQPPGPVAPPQRFPVSPFAPQPSAPAVPQGAPNAPPGQVPGQPNQPPPQ